MQIEEIMMDCIFCEIIARKIPATVLREDDLTISFLDIHQSNDGHCLVVSKEHFPRAYDLPGDVAGALFAHASLLAKAMNETIAPDGIQIWQSNGAAAGQEIDHVHIHVFPRYTGDGHFRIYPSPPRTASVEELEAIAKPLVTYIETHPSRAADNE
jgi:histidine triad (HIT) family protein